MASPPYMRFFLGDYFADTGHLTCLQHGIYFQLISRYFQRGSALPADDRYLANLVRLGPREWAKHREVLADFFQVVDGKWFHQRIEDEIAFVESKSLKSKAAGQASAERRLSDRPTPVQRPFNHTDTDTDTDTEDTQEGILTESVDPNELLFAWGEAAKAHNLPTVLKLTAERRKKAIARIGDYGLDAALEAIRAIPSQPFLLGQNDRGWKANFDWFLRPDTITRIMEGNYGKQSRAGAWDHI